MNNLTQRIKLVFISYLLFLVLNVISYVLVLINNGVGFNNISWQMTIIGPLVFCIIVLIIISLWKSKIAIYSISLLFLFLKIGLIVLKGYTIEVADLIIVFSNGFSIIFNIFQSMLQQYKYVNPYTEILLHVGGVFIYQVLILYVSTKLYRKISPAHNKTNLQ